MKPEHETSICVIHQAQLSPPWCNCPEILHWVIESCCKPGLCSLKTFLSIIKVYCEVSRFYKYSLHVINKMLKELALSKDLLL